MRCARNMLQWCDMLLLFLSRLLESVRQFSVVCPLCSALASITIPSRALRGCRNCVGVHVCPTMQLLVYTPKLQFGSKDHKEVTHT